MKIKETRLRRLLTPDRAIALGLWATASAGFAPIAQASDIAQTIHLAVSGAPEIIYSYDHEKCDVHDIPDAPARAFRDNKGGVHLFAASAENTGFILNESTFRHDCTPALISGHDSDPSKMNDRSFLAAFWSDKNVVYALVHTEYHADLYNRCAVKNAYLCWYNWITTAVSVDTGATFQRPEQNFVVAAPTNKQRADQSEPDGYFNPTNIIKTDFGYYYTIVSMSKKENYAGGACILRSHNVADASAWRAWNGKKFDISFEDPYDAKAALPRDATDRCQPLHGVGGTVTSLNVISSAKTFILTSFHTELRAGQQVGVLSYYESKNLVDWSRPATLFVFVPYNSTNPLDIFRYAYGSLIDLSQADSNFSEIGKSTYLYMTRFNVGSGRTAMDRDLVRFPISIEHN